MSPQVESASEMLVKAAADADGIVARMMATSMEKEAGFWSAGWDATRRLGQGMMKTFTRPANPAGALPKPRPAPAPAPTPKPAPAPAPVPKPRLPPMGPRELSGGRIAATLGTAAGAGGAGAIGYGHMQNSAENTVGKSWNPLTWMNPQSEDQVFNRNKDKAQGMFDERQTAQNAAIDRGDFDAAESIGKEMETGEFGRSNWLQRNLNPFQSQESGRAYADRARGFQAGDQGKIEAMQANLKKWGPRMTPERRAAMQAKIEELTKHKAIQVPFGGAPAAPAPTGGGNFPSQQSPGGIQHGAARPYDYRQHMYEAALQQGGLAGY